MQKCLIECTRLKLQSIAIPSIRADNLTYPDDVVARCLLNETASYLDKNKGKTTLQTVNFVILNFMPRTYQVFQKYFKSLASSSASPHVSSGKEVVSSESKSSSENGTEKIAEEPATVAVERIEEEEEWEDPSDCFGSDVPSELNEVVITIFGRTNDTLQHAEKLILKIVEDQFIHEVLLDKEISKLTRDQVRALKKEASLKNVEIEIDCDPALHQIKLHACRADVLYMKDKVREAVYKVREAPAKLQENAMLSATKTVHQHIHWVRQLSDGDDEYDEVLNYEIEQAYQQKQSYYKCNKSGEEFVIVFKTMQETDLDIGDVVRVKRVVAEG